jgi:hypothetical protein
VKKDGFRSGVSVPADPSEWWREGGAVWVSRQQCSAKNGPRVTEVAKR